MTFRQDWDRIKRRIRRLENELYKRCVNHAFRSIRFGSSVTGAPGQPVDKGILLRSWKKTTTAARVTRMSSDAPHAGIIEDNIRGAQLRSKVGGFHSVKTTRMNWPLIVAYEANKLKSSGLTEIKSTMVGPDAG